MGDKPNIAAKAKGGARNAQAIHKQRVRNALKAMAEEGLINDLAETFRALSDPTRLRIVAALSEKELCVHNLADALALSGSAVSHQLRLLRGQRLVKYRKEGKTAYYTLDDEHISALFAEGVRHVKAR